MPKPIIAIVGRPNVGKSTFFNKITGERKAIVEDVPGVTRDRIYAQTEWNGRALVFIDTGGIEPKTNDEILLHIKTQAEIAIDTADMIIFLTDIHAGVTANDKEIAKMLQKCGKPVILAVNKVDSIGEPPMEFYEFYELGLGDPIPVSSIHGSGTGDLLDIITETIPDTGEEDEDEERIKVCVIGKPNAGKSSLINYILKDERLIVSDVAGTTRDAIDTYVDNEFGKYTFIDTAGIRRQSKVDDRIEKYSVLRAKLAVDRSDVCVIMIDADIGITEQDEKVAGIAHESGKPSIICINKWDLIEKDDKTVNKFTNDVRIHLGYMTYAPIMFISAKTGQRVVKLFEQINFVHSESLKRIRTGVLNDILADSIMKVQPPTDKGKRLKIYYMTQTSVKPPNFVIFCNNAELFHFSYQRYIENQIRQAFGFEGTPIRLTIRERGEEDG